MTRIKKERHPPRTQPVLSGAKKNFKKYFIGRWVSSLPWDSADLLVEYNIKLKRNKFQISAKDLQDNEKFIISNISFNYNTLRFVSFVPSTKRKGINKFQLLDKDRIQSEFTFAVIEELRRK